MDLENLKDQIERMRPILGAIAKMEEGTCFGCVPSRLLRLALLVCMLCAWGVDCGDNDFRICVTTDLEDGLFIQCLSEDKSVKKLPKKVMPGDLTYTLSFGPSSPLFFSYFHCTVTNHEGNTMTFSAFDKRYAEKKWRFPVHNDMREIRWSVNRVGAWMWRKGRPRADSIMKWEFVDFWPPWPPPLPPSNQSGPSNWDQLEEHTREPVTLKPRILPPIYIPDFIMKPFEEPLHVLPWYLKGPWK